MAPRKPAILAVWFTFAAMAAGPAIFQVRLVRNAPSSETEEMTCKSIDGQTETLAVQKTALLDLTSVESAAVTRDGRDKPQIDIWLTPQGAARFAEETSQIVVDQQIAIVIDGTVWADPMIRAPLNLHFLPVRGDFTEKQAGELAARINAAVRKK
jgi:preprotein translocase subunit SecD